jgi:hypothetical protein
MRFAVFRRFRRGAGEGFDQAQGLFKTENRRVRFSGPEAADPQRKARRRVFLRVRAGKEQKVLGIKALP